MCLQWLDGLDLRGKTVIEFGCGSGILAIAALKLGAVQAISIDIDPQAIQASRDNAQRNGVADRLTPYLPQTQPRELHADVVVANIFAGPLRELAPLIIDLPRPGVFLGLSGTSQAQSVVQYAAAFALYPVAEDEWCRITGLRRKGKPGRGAAKSAPRSVALYRCVCPARLDQRKFVNAQNSLVF